MELLGASHLVVAAQDLDRAQSQCEGAGFVLRGEAAGLVNPPGKQGVVKGPMRPTCTMRLMTRADAPPVEVVREDGAESAPEEPALLFHAFALAGEDPPWAAGLRATLEDPARALALPCRDLESAAAAWRCAGLALEPCGAGRLRVTVPRSLIGSALTLVYCQEETAPETGWVNAPGLSAASFFCKDADRLWQALTDAGLEPGAPFDLEPFGRPVRIFFLRNASGEVLEFLSARRVQSGKPSKPSA